MATAFEIWSFMQKFEQLSRNGSHAEMHLSCLGGKIWINLHTEVNDVCQSSPPHQDHVRSRPSPSRVRRRQRRKNARITPTARVECVDETHNYVQDHDVRTEDSWLISFEENDSTTINNMEDTLNIQESLRNDTTSQFQSPVQVCSVEGFSTSSTGAYENTNGDGLIKDDPSKKFYTKVEIREREPSDVELQMYRMLQHLTART